MSAEDFRLARRVTELREEFDRAFTRAHPAAAPPHLDLLQIGVGGRSYALRLADVVELVADRTVVPVPSPRPELLGLAGLRGVVTPVYDLSLELGYSKVTRPRWLAKLRAPTPFAVGFDHFERHLRVLESALATSRGPADGAFVRASVSLEPHPLPVIDLPAIFESVTRRRGAPAPAPAQERG